MQLRWLWVPLLLAALAILFIPTRRFQQGQQVAIHTPKRPQPIVLKPAQLAVPQAADSHNERGRSRKVGQQQIARGLSSSDQKRLQQAETAAHNLSSVSKATARDVSPSLPSLRTPSS